MSRNTDTVNTYLDGFRKLDHAQILSCLTDDVAWTVFGAFQLSGKQAYDEAIEGPGFTGPARLHVVRMVEQDDVVMAELTGEATRRRTRRYPDGSLAATGTFTTAGTLGSAAVLLTAGVVPVGAGSVVGSVVGVGSVVLVAEGEGLVVW
jgi:ketosteroid isomerase-like protein